MSAGLFWVLEVVTSASLHVNRMVRYPIMHDFRCWCLVMIDRARRSCDYVLRAQILILLLFVHHYVWSCCSRFFDEELACRCCRAIIIHFADLICVSYDCLCRFVDDLTIRFTIDYSTCAVSLLLILALWCPLRIIYVKLLWLVLIFSCLALVIRRYCQRCTFSLVVW